MEGVLLRIEAKERKCQVLVMVDTEQGEGVLPGMHYVRWSDCVKVGQKGRRIPVFNGKDAVETRSYKDPERMKFFRGRVRSTIAQAINSVA